MQEFINTFFGYKFFPSLIIGALAFSAYRPRRRFFVLRFIFCFCVMTALSGFMWKSVRYFEFGSSLGSFMYVLCDVFFFFEVIALLCFCFKCRFFEAVLYDAAGCSLEHIANSVSIIFGILLGIENIYFNYDIEYFVLTILVYLVVYCTGYLAGWVLCRNGKIKLNSKRVLLPAVLVLFITVILGVYVPVAETFPNAMVIIKLFAVICCMVSLCSALNLFEAGQYRYELDMVEQLDRKRREQYEIQKDTIDAVNIKCHDLKKMISSVLGKRNILSADELEKLEGQISIYDAIVKTGNDALDLILTEKSLYCEKNKIKLTIMAEGGDLSFMSDADIYSLFGNILDNAVEAVMKVEPERRAVTLSIKTVGNMIVVHEQNYFAGKIKFVNGTPATSKNDTSQHGYGILSIRRIVEKYDGGLDISAEGDIYTLNAAVLRAAVPAAVAV